MEKKLFLVFNGRSEEWMNAKLFCLSPSDPPPPPIFWPKLLSHCMSSRWPTKATTNQATSQPRWFRNVINKFLKTGSLVEAAATKNLIFQSWKEGVSSTNSTKWYERARANNSLTLPNNNLLNQKTFWPQLQLEGSPSHPTPGCWS